MGRYFITPAADVDLEEIWQFVSRTASDARADALEEELHGAMCKLADSPGMGHVRDDLADESLRIWNVHQFLIVYRAGELPIQIVRVLHGARDVQAILGNGPDLRSTD